MKTTVLLLVMMFPAVASLAVMAAALIARQGQPVPSDLAPSSPPQGTPARNPRSRRRQTLPKPCRLPHVNGPLRLATSFLPDRS